MTRALVLVALLAAACKPGGSSSSSSGASDGSADPWAGKGSASAAPATPGGDLVSPAVLAATMYLLFELTLRFIRRTGH